MAQTVIVKLTDDLDGADKATPADGSKEVRGRCTQ